LSNEATLDKRRQQLSANRLLNKGGPHD
jgi:hypothetical protein